MLSIYNNFLKIKIGNGLKLIFILINLSLVACSIAPYQEMSDARQIITAVTLEIEESGLTDSASINTIIEKAKFQLSQAKSLLNENKFDEARVLALKASKLAQLAKTEVNKQK